MRRMIFLLSLAVVVRAAIVPGRAAGQDAAEAKETPTAYTALRLVGKSLGADAINRVVEVTGRNGTPQPNTWKIILKEGEGSREVEVVNGKIEAQRPLARPVAAAPIKLQDLNLDSSGAFDVTDAQARKVHVRFDSVNYTLRSSEKTAKPLWTLDLFNQEGMSAGTMRIAAHSGAVASLEGRIAGGSGSTPPVVASTDKPPVKPEATPARVTSRPATSPKPAVVDAGRAAPQREVKNPPVVTTTTTTTSIQTLPPTTAVVDVPDAAGPAPLASSSAEESGGFFTRAGRTLDHTSHSVGHSLDRANQDVNHSLRRAGATVQRFFTGHSELDGDSRPAPPSTDGQPD